MQLDAEYVSFIVRLWREPAIEQEQFDAAAHKWLAQIEHIPTGEQRYFSSLEDLFAFMGKWAGAHMSK